MGNAVLLYSAIQGKMLKIFITRVSSRLIVAIYCYAVILIAVWIPFPMKQHSGFSSLTSITNRAEIDLWVGREMLFLMAYVPKLLHFCLV